MGRCRTKIIPLIFFFCFTISVTRKRFDAGVWSEYSLPVEISDDENHDLLYYAVDKTGNIETTRTADISIDQTPPEVTLSKQTTNLFEITFTAQVSDEASGIDRVEFSIDGQVQYSDTQSPYEWTCTGLGNYTVTATAFDRAGNSKSQSQSTPVESTHANSSPQLQMTKQSMILSLYNQMLI
jgi:hypothetical protein